MKLYHYNKRQIKQANEKRKETKNNEKINTCVNCTWFNSLCGLLRYRDLLKKKGSK